MVLRARAFLSDTPFDEAAALSEAMAKALTDFDRPNCFAAAVQEGMGVQVQSIEAQYSSSSSSSSLSSPKEDKEEVQTAGNNAMLTVSVIVGALAGAGLCAYYYGQSRFEDPKQDTDRRRLDLWEDSSSTSSTLHRSGSTSRHKDRGSVVTLDPGNPCVMRGGGWRKDSVPPDSLDFGEETMEQFMEQQSDTNSLI